MKTVRLRGFCKLPLILKTGVAITAPLLFWLLRLGIQVNEAGLVWVGAVPLLAYIAGLAFFYSYGIKVTPEKISVMFHNTLKSFRFEKLEYVELEFGNNVLKGKIKPCGKKIYSFEFSDFLIDPASSVSRFLQVKVKITEAMAEKIAVELLPWEKISIKSDFSTRKK